MSRRRERGGRGRLRRRTRQVARAEAPRPAAGHARRDRGGQHVRRAYRGSNQRKARVDPTRPGSGDVRRSSAHRVIKEPPLKPVVAPAVAALPGEERVLRAAEKALSGETRGLRALVPFLGPAFVAAVAYVDPGNFATNIAGGAQYGYMLLWVVLAAHLMAMLVQSISAKLSIAGTESVLLGVGILGATVMPHVIYLHSALTQRRVVGVTEIEKQKIYRFERWDVIIAMGLAGIINIAMLTIAAAALHGRNVGDIQSLDQAFKALGHTLDHGADIFFGLGLLASGLSSSSVGTLAGSEGVKGLILRHIPLL